MKRNNIKIFFMLLLTTLFIAGCSDDDSPFSGEDHYISSFHLQQGDITLKAAISADSIIITAPENLSLSGAIADVVLSENATIDPQISTIKEWDNNQDLTVTAYNGTKKTYHYTVKRGVVSRDGDIILLTQEDVETLAALGLSQINGSLTIGSSTGTDSVFSLVPLAGLKTIVFDLMINPTYAGVDLAGLENLERIGSLKIDQVKSLKTAEFTKLNTVISNLVVNQTMLRTLKFPELAKVDRSLQILSTDSLTAMEFPKLASVIEGMTIQAGWGENKLTSINFPSLAKVGGNINISQWKEVKSVNFPLLTSATAISVTSLTKMETFVAPKLQSVLGNFTFSYNLLLTTLDVSSLQKVSGGLRLENISIETLNGLKSLTSVDGEFFISDVKELKNIEGLKSLKSIGGRMYLSNWPALEDATLQGLSSINNIGGEVIISQVPFKKFSGFALTKISSLGIYGNGLSSIEEIDVSKIEIEKSLTISTISTAFKLKGKDVFAGKLIVDGSSLNLEGFKEVGDFSYNMSTKQNKTETVSIKKVNGDLTLNIYNFDTFSMPNLEEIGGKFNIAVSGKMEILFPALKKSGAMDVNVTPMDMVSFPSLQLVDGDCKIVTANYLGSISEIKMPALKKITGILNLSGYSNWYANTNMTNLDGFSALTEVKGVKIEYNEALVNFAGLKNAVNSLTATEWSVSDNAYNPTFDDMKAGKWISK